MTAGEEACLLSVVVPVYNTPAVELLVSRIHDALVDHPHEILLVDDASPRPDVWPALERLAGSGGGVRAIRLSRNFGQHAATMCGLAHARGVAVVTIDDDLQHDPADILKLLTRADHDVVVASFSRRGHSLHRRLGSRGKSWLERFAIGKPRELRFSSFRLMRRSVVDAIVAMDAPRPFIPALIVRVTRDIVSVPVMHVERREGTTGYSARKLLRVVTDMLVSNSTRARRHALTGAKRQPAWVVRDSVMGASDRQNDSTASTTRACSP